MNYTRPTASYLLRPFIDLSISAGTKTAIRQGINDFVTENNTTSPVRFTGVYVDSVVPALAAIQTFTLYFLLLPFIREYAGVPLLSCMDASVHHSVFRDKRGYVWRSAWENGGRGRDNRC